MARALKVRVTEAEWLEANRIVSLDLYRSAFGQTRKWRLFGCASARRALAFLPNAHWPEIVVAAERFAEGELTWEDMKRARKVLFSPRCAVSTDEFTPDNKAAHAIVYVTERGPHIALGAAEQVRFAFGESRRPDWNAGHDAE